MILTRDIMHRVGRSPRFTGVYWHFPCRSSNRFGDDMNVQTRTALVALISLTLAASASGQLAQKKSLTLEVAKQIAAAAEKEAAGSKLTMVIAILDDGGNLVYLERMDETQIGSIEVAQQKARSAIFFK